MSVARWSPADIASASAIELREYLASYVRLHGWTGYSESIFERVVDRMVEFYELHRDTHHVPSRFEVSVLERAEIEHGAVPANVGLAARQLARAVQGACVMPSPRKLLAVYRESKSGSWVATFQQGCIVERVVVLKFTNAFDMDLPEREAEARARAEVLV